MRTAQERSKRPIIIVLQSDEGPYPWRILERSPAVFSDMTPDEMQVKFGNLNAIYMPSFPEDFAMPATPVNNFRILFGAILGTQLPMEEDSIWLKQSDARPNALRDISSELAH